MLFLIFTRYSRPKRLSRGRFMSGSELNLSLQMTSRFKAQSILYNIGSQNGTMLFIELLMLKKNNSFQATFESIDNQRDSIVPFVVEILLYLHLTASLSYKILITKYVIKFNSLTNYLNNFFLFLLVSLFARASATSLFGRHGYVILRLGCSLQFLRH